jgi:DNA replication and repair protein RecF
MFSPEDLALVKGAPEERRRFLDNAGTLTRPLAAADRMDFERALRQRNSALRAARSNPRAAGQLDVWGEQVALAGAAVVRNRLAVLEWLKPAVQRRYQELAAVTPPELEYEPSWTAGEPIGSVVDLAQALRGALDRARAVDLERGITSLGPHRDDLSIILGGADTRLYASQGEQRTLALALRLAERDAVAGAAGEEPILLLDDVFSELDPDRRVQLSRLVATTGQTVVTATTAESVPMRGGLVLAVEGGRLSRVG